MLIVWNVASQLLVWQKSAHFMFWYIGIWFGSSPLDHIFICAFNYLFLFFLGILFFLFKKGYKIQIIIWACFNRPVLHGSKKKVLRLNLKAQTSAQFDLNGFVMQNLTDTVQYVYTVSPYLKRTITKFSNKCKPRSAKFYF